MLPTIIHTRKHLFLLQDPGEQLRILTTAARIPILDDFEFFCFAGVVVDVVRQDLLRLDDKIQPVILIDDLFQFLCSEKPIILIATAFLARRL